MTRQDFEEYKYLNKRIKQTEKLIERLRTQLAAEREEWDVVKGSSAEFPYIAKTFHIQGHNASEAASVRQYIREQQAYKQKLENLKKDIEEYIRNIPDMKVQYIMTERFIHDRRIKDIANETNYSRSRISHIIIDAVKKAESVKIKR